VSFARLVLSYGGCGMLPKIPGTWGTAGAAVTAWAFLAYWPDARANWLPLCVAWVVVASVLTVLLTPVIEAEDGIKDPQVIVTDEVAGYWATLALARHPDLTTLALAFFVFRFLDVWKPPPARQLERLPSGWGVLTDDVMSGVYGAAIVWGLDRVIVLS
jgi:phosphatidylglycerophosphatase A